MPMQLILDKKTSGKKRKKSPLQTRFDKLNEQLQRKRRQHERFKQDIDQLAQQSQRLNAEHDRAQLDVLITLSRKLTSFAGRKSLSNWHRDELLNWLSELILLRITPFEPQIAHDLRVEYEDTMARLSGMTREEVAEFVQAQEEEAARRAQQWNAEAEDSNDQAGGWHQDDLFGFDDDELPPLSEQADQEGSNFDPFMGFSDPRESRVNITDSGWLKGLFRRAAQALHPDRETNPEQRLKKQQRMKELLLARKQNDVMTMLSIYSETLGETDILIAETEMETICTLLTQQIEQLELDQMEYVESHPERSFAHAVLYHPSRKQREQLLKEWKKSLAEEANDNRRLVAEMRNLTLLKDALRDRWHRRNSMIQHEMEVMFGFEDW